MARKLMMAASALGLWALSGAAWASGDGGCYARWKLFAKGRECASRAMLAPGNDTRVNMLFLLRDRAGLGMTGFAYPKQGWDDEGYGHIFLDWGLLRASLISESSDSETNYAGSRCASVVTGAPTFLAALAASRSLPAAERQLLQAARGRLDKVCENGVELAMAARRGRFSSDGSRPPALPTLPEWPSGIGSTPGKAFLAYLQASDAFYSERWDEARSGFASLGRAKEPWVAEAAAYMLARVDLNAAIVKAFDEYGYFQGTDSIDRLAVQRAGAALTAYLKAFPQGRYAMSAQGLRRRVLWLAGDRTGLATEYARLFGAARGDGEAASELVEEIDNKLLFPYGEESDALAQGPWLLAAQDFARMRDERPDSGEGDGPKLTAAALEAQQATFAGHPELFAFLQASHALHVANDPKRVLQLIPDDARRPSYAPLAFSRQMLRGMALSRLNDRNEAGFWIEMLNGANGLWQRPTVELALAMHYERHGKLASVFAKDLPVTESGIREILLANSGGPDLLRAQALDRSRPLAERTVALFTLLDKQLSRGDYAGFVASLRIAVPAMEGEGAGLAWNSSRQLPSFGKGRWTDGYPCPAVVQTARTLAANPQSVPARLCLGDFWRLNDFYMGDGQSVSPPKDELGGALNAFPGKPLMRGPIYAAIMDDQTASAGDKAYALYRAVNCYGPSGSNSCGGPDVERSQRRAWFQRLKRDYPGSQWATKQRYFW